MKLSIIQRIKSGTCSYVLLDPLNIILNAVFVCRLDFQTFLLHEILLMYL